MLVDDGVAPRTGARIETRAASGGSISVSSPLAQGRGSKLPGAWVGGERGASPLAQGRGSKRSNAAQAKLCHEVAPRTGARIETTHRDAACRGFAGRPSHRGADRNNEMKKGLVETLRRPSHRGADRNDDPRKIMRVTSWSPLAQGRGSKRAAGASASCEPRVAPRTGARIETNNRCSMRQCRPGRPSHRGADRNYPSCEITVDALESPLAQGRGSKLHRDRAGSHSHAVAPRTGARIETRACACCSSFLRVAPRTGARIETMSCAGEGHAPLVAPRTGARIETNALSWRA